MSEESLICAPIGRRNPERPFGVKPGLTAVEAGPLAIAPCRCHCIERYSRAVGYFGVKQ